jgi:putative ABC transport system permease protein
MISVALKGLAQHRLRTLLTTLAIIVGVATMSAAFTLSDTMQKGSDALSSASYDGTAAVVSAKTAFERSVDGYTKAPTISESTLHSVRTVPGVGVAVGDLTNTNTKLLKPSGDPIGDGPYFGVGLDSRAEGVAKVTPFRLREGRWATGPGQVVIDASSADREHLGVGDGVRIAATGPARTFRVVGIARFGAVKSIGTTCAPRRACSASAAPTTRSSWRPPPEPTRPPCGAPSRRRSRRRPRCSARRSMTASRSTAWTSS